MEPRFQRIKTRFLNGRLTMSKNPNQKLKLLYLYQILLQRTDENHKLTTDELRAALERCGITAERKSIYSDIEALQNFGLDVICQRGTGGGYYVASREFELPELKLLVDAIQCSRFITEKKSNELIGKIEHLTSDHEAHTLQRQVYVSERVKTLNEQIYYNIDALHAAISNDVQITFRYFNWVLNFSASPRIQKQYRRDGARYRISPWALTWDNENYYLIGFDDDSKEIRHYRVDKMLNITITAEKRDGGDQFSKFDIGNYSKRTFGMFAGDENTLEIEFDNNLIGVVMDRFGKDIILNSNTENTFVAKLNVNISSQFYGWLAGLGTGVKILSPQSEVEKYLTYIKDISSKYTHF